MGWIQQVKRWLTADRVRVSPQAGLWLGLQVGQRIIWDDRLWKINHRQAIEDNQRVGVSYHLVELSDEQSLRMSEVPPIICDDAAVAVYPELTHTIRIDCFCEYD